MRLRFREQGLIAAVAALFADQGSKLALLYWAGFAHMPPGSSIPGAPPATSLTGPAPTANSFGGAMSQIGPAAGGRAAGVVLPYVAAALAPAAGNGFVWAILVDGGSAALSEEFDDLQKYIQTHNVNLGPFDFIKSDY